MEVNSIVNNRMDENVLCPEVTAILKCSSNVKQLARYLFKSNLSADVRRTFHHYARIIHPDKCSDNRSADAFRLLFECYTYVLENPDVISNIQSNPFVNKSASSSVTANVSKQELSLTEILNVFKQCEEEFLKENAVHVAEHEKARKRKKVKMEATGELNESYFESFVDGIDNRAGKWQKFKAK